MNLKQRLTDIVWEARIRHAACKIVGETMDMFDKNIDEKLIIEHIARELSVRFPELRMKLENE